MPDAHKTGETMLTLQDITTDDARRYLADVGISDPTPALIEMAQEAAQGVVDALTVDPTVNDYGGELTGIADLAGSAVTLDDLAGSHDALNYDHGFGDVGGLAEQIGATVYAILSNVVQVAYADMRPDPSGVAWSDVPTRANGDVLIGRTDTAHVYVSVQWDGDRLSITGHDTDGGGGQIDMHIMAGDITPAPWHTADDIAELWRVWDRWHMNNANAGCEHQTAAARAWGTLTHETWAVGEACPVCEYRYGTEWIFEPVPADVVAFLRRFQDDRDADVREILRRENPGDPSGEWSAADIADRLAWERGGTVIPFLDDIAAVRAAIGRLGVSGRYVGGTSRYLYSLPYAESEGGER